MKFLIQYNLKTEQDFIKDLLKKLTWFNNNNYKINLPKNISPDSNKNEINKTVEEEFNGNKNKFEKVKFKTEKE